MKLNQYQEELEDLNRRMKAAEMARIGYWELDLKTRKIIWSREMYKLYGFHSEHISHKMNVIRKQILPDDISIYKSKIKELLTTRKPVNAILRVRNKKNGEILYCYFNANYVEYKDSRKIMGTFQDLSDLIKMQIALDKAKRQAEQRDLAKSYFLGQASHDLRQPMTALKIFIYNLGSTDLKPAQQKILNRISDTANNLSFLLNNFLDISKLDAGGFVLESERFSIGLVLQKIYDEYQVTTAARGIKLKFVSCDCEIESDPLLIERAMRNLLTNAMKYTKNKILLGCKRNNKIMQILVSDNGCGVDEKDLPHLFEEFYQSEKIKDNKLNGAGLGLSIVKKITTLLGGDINVKSRINKGSCFILELPL